MTLRKKDQKNLVKVGVFITFLTVILMVMIASIGKESSLFDEKIIIRARVENVSNLKIGSYVELKGIRIGTVTEINIISDDEVELLMKILKKELRWIKKDSKVSINTAGLVGDKFVEINSGTKESSLFNYENDYLTLEEQADLKKMIAKGDSIAQVTESILVKIDLILSKMGDGKMLTETLSSLNKTSKNFEIVSSELKEAKMAQTIKNVNTTMMSLEKIINRIEKGPGTINSLIYDESVHDDLRALLGGAQRNKAINYFIRESIKKSEQRSR